MKIILFIFMFWSYKIYVFFPKPQEISINAYNWYFYPFSLNQGDKKIKIGFNPLMIKECLVSCNSFLIEHHT